MSKRNILSELRLASKEYLLLTIHRQENTDNPENLKSILAALETCREKIVFPVHPRTEKALEKNKINLGDYPHFVTIKPVGYLDMLALEKNAGKILTDSGGVQKEAFWFQVPCITLREETEWVETLANGWNVLVGADQEKIRDALGKEKTAPALGGPASRAAEKIVKILSDNKVL